MAGANNNNTKIVGENQPLTVHPLNGQLASGTEGDDRNYMENVPESPMGNPPLPP
ncbi:hypothetical protein A2U01_0091913, partial [Trifolium medium]|nr:hypothetical protein [Trifolium medium]